ncbi:MAG TPA: Rrf2 family transcriptional regulator [Azospirillum sp.]|nr:Rrf2 family transcriptional regulator [Azospirillum sp.]
MQITRYTDYGIRVLAYCALKRGELATTQEIADRYGVSGNHLVKVVQELSRLGYLDAVRGKGGGIRLALAPESINLGTLVRQLEDLEVVECFEAGNAACRITPACRLQGILGEALRAFIGVLSRHTLADVVAPRGELARLLDLPNG